MGSDCGRGKANDLKEQLIYWQTPPEAGWQAWEERIEWLQQAIAQLKDVTVGMQQHGVRIEHSPHIRHYMTILRVLSFIPAATALPPIPALGNMSTPNMLVPTPRCNHCVFNNLGISIHGIELLFAGSSLAWPDMGWCSLLTLQQRCCSGAQCAGGTLIGAIWLWQSVEGSH